jgi:hypothetical protein
MQFSCSEILNSFSIPEGITVHRASYLKASKSKRLPRAEICFSIRDGSKIKKQKNISVDANLEEFQAAVADLIVSLAPLSSGADNPIFSATNTEEKNEDKIPTPRIRLRSKSLQTSKLGASRKYRVQKSRLSQFRAD